MCCLEGHRLRVPLSPRLVATAALRSPTWSDVRGGRDVPGDPVVVLGGQLPEDGGAEAGVCAAW